MVAKKLKTALIALTPLYMASCGSPSEEPQKPSPPVSDPTPYNIIDLSKAADSWEDKVKNVDFVSLTPPENFDRNKHLTLEYMRWETPPKSTGDFPHASRKMTIEEGRKLFFDGILPLVNSANTPSPSSSEFGAAINQGQIVKAACATTNSQVLEFAARKAGLNWMVPLFEDPWGYLPTHNNEYQFMLLGWHYYLMDDYVSPAGSVGAWTRYTFYGIPDHTGHIYITFEDLGADTSPLVGDNTRLSSEPHGHLYRPSGRPVGFWLPPGVYPNTTR